MTGLWVLHGLGDIEGGAPWAAAFADWTGPVTAPDLPGHGSAPPPVGGHFGPGEELFAVADRFPSPDDAPVVVGVGHSSRAALLLAIAGRACATVVVDGLGGPWGDATERNAAFRRYRRAMLDDPAALAPVPPGTLDPRHAIDEHVGDRDFSRRLLASVPVPLLAIESPASTTPDAADLLADIASATVATVPSAAPSAVADHVAAWWSGLASPTSH